MLLIRPGRAPLTRGVVYSARQRVARSFPLPWSFIVPAYIAINCCRTSTDDGPANTWRVYRCDAYQRNSILKYGLPVHDQETIDDAGNRGPVYSTNGVRTATATERRHCVDWLGAVLLCDGGQIPA